MFFHPSVHSFSGYGDEPAQEVTDPAKESAKTTVDQENKRQQRIKKRRKKALQRAKRQAIVIPAIVGGSLLLVGFLGLGIKTLAQKKASKAKVAQ